MKLSTTTEPVNRKRNTKRRDRPFIAWDGEGYTVAGSHHYALFGSSTGLRVSGRLTWRDCMRLLFEADADAHHVIYAGTYDVVMMFRDTPIAAQLLKGETVVLEQYRLRFLRGKFLRVTDREKHETRTLFDVFTFFGTSFVKACREYLGASSMLDEMEEMKSQRSLFTKNDVLNGAVEPYMASELKMLVELCTALRERLAMVNIHPAQWHGPGAVASTVLRDHGIKKHKGVYSEEFRQVAESAYYGGRFEQFKRGTYEGTVYQYDIRSAYPDAMQHLMSLANVRWTRVRSPKIVDPLLPTGLYKVECMRTNHPFGYLPYRNKAGSIYYPQWVDGWYWGVEIPRDLWSFIEEAWFPCEQGPVDIFPFTFVAEMYEQRAKLKAANQPHQLALKLALNSLYGKLAQSKGASKDGLKWKYPTFHESVWAGWITAYTRRKISDALHSVNPSSIIATETDSVFSLEPLPVSVGEGLGEWDCDVLDGIKYIQSGVSLVKRNNTWNFKTRGFTVKRTENEVEIWSKFLAMKNPILTVKQTRFGTDARQDTFGQWYETTHNLRFDNGMEKRIHNWCPNCEVGTYNECLHDLIVPPIPMRPSEPYKFMWRRDPNDTVDMIKELLEESHDDPVLRLEYT